MGRAFRPHSNAIIPGYTRQIRRVMAKTLNVVDFVAALTVFERVAETFISFVVTQQARQTATSPGDLPPGRPTVRDKPVHPTGDGLLWWGLPTQPDPSVCQVTQMATNSPVRQQFTDSVTACL
ncbi:hypothetical protein KSP40_PGU004109 [Platanthera guangdongensis]|uniref:Uncharacterized protein n=1 Tax=Platanthera guangdongensis TaxID=2320717 RepID=A0ABR2LEB5_9ASPA